VGAATATEIGEAAAAAAVAIAMAIDDYAAGGAMTPATRSWSGAMLGRVAELRLNTLGDPQDDFSAIAYREGKRALHARPDGVLLAHLGAGQVDALIGHVIAIAEKVVRDELALRAN
jgi:hypothetical protein